MIIKKGGYMLILIILGIFTIIFIIMGIIIHFVFDPEMLQWILFFIACCFLIGFCVIGGLYISANEKVKYINKRYEKKYTVEEYFYNGNIIELDIVNLYDFKLRVDER